MSEQYTVRPFASGDREDFLSLFEAVLGGDVDDEWFEWKYVDNPFVDHVPIVVAAEDGRVVGARSLFALRMAAGDRRYDALEPCDTMVHPDHRRRGLFTRMNERAIERYADRADLFFNFPNDRALPGNRKLGWRVVERPATYYRIQRASALAPRAGRVGDAAARGYLRLRERLADAGGDYGVEWVGGVPAETLASLADESVPGLHAARGEPFYRWRFADPRRSYETVLATDGGEPVAALVVGESRSDGGPTVVRVADVLPLGDVPGRTRALATLLDAVVDASVHADLLVASDALPSSVLSSRGFHSDRRPPLSLVASPSVHVVRPLPGRLESWSLDGQSLTDPETWRLTLAEVDGT